ncbi:hypothetical protein GCM10010251_53680 [Streptomyces aurantiogriseus]|uniref:Peptidase n=1 Tax=Streptomyces aurantiogriseus TaxID=66870 RepID=A0A918CNM0_9ACTN|nr:hypothetical protein GCM10010251_53680 [Streptomyces aurantiogriseus]
MTVSFAAVLATAAAPAAADGSDGVALRLEAPATFVMYNADEGAKAANGDFQVPVAVVPGNTEPARNIKVVVDASGLEGVARVGKGNGGNCTGSGWVWTCEYGTLQNDGESTPPFTLHGVDGVRPGDSGTVTYTASADNAAPVTGITRMTVGGPTLHSPEEEERVTGVEPGKPARLTPRFANHSRFTAEQGVALRITAQGGLLVTSRPGNCYFNSTSTSAWCGFPAKAAAGTAYRVSSPLTYTAAPDELTGLLSYSWSSDPQRPAEHPVRGTGAPLTLTRTAGRGLTSGSTNVAVETTVQADYTPVAGTVRGRVGDTVSVRLGVRDLGPGRLSDDVGRFEVVPPEGTTVTSIPFTFEDTDGKWACDRPKKTGGAFVCDLDSGRFWPGDDGTTTVDFRFRVDRQVPGARGTIRTYGPYDRTPGNDIAVIPLEASPAPPYRSALRPAVLVPAVLVAVAAVAGVLLYRRRRRGPASS